MASAGMIGACAGSVVVLVFAACSRSGDGPLGSPTQPSGRSATEVRVERGGGTTGGTNGGTVGNLAIVNGVFEFDSGHASASGTYEGQVIDTSPNTVTFKPSFAFSRKGDAVFTLPVTSLNSSQTRVTLVMSVSPNDETRILDFRVDFTQTFTSSTDASCLAGQRHTFTLEGEVPQFGRSVMTFSHCAPVF